MHNRPIVYYSYDFAVVINGVYLPVKKTEQ